MRIAHFIQRYSPAQGGSEAYFARLSQYLVQRGDAVTVFTTNALDLEAFWSSRGKCLPAGTTVEEGVEVRRYPVVHWPGRRYFLKGLSLFPHPLWQCWTLPCNPISPALWRDLGRGEWNFEVVHASALPYAWLLVCARRLALRLKVPFCVTPFLHLGDPQDPQDPIRRAYTSRPLRWLLRQADLLFVQTPSERRELLRQGIPEKKVVLQGLGVDPADCTGGDRNRARQVWGIGPGEVVIGHLANQSREKGTIDLLQAANLLWQRGLPVRIVLAGPQMPNFQKFWEKWASNHGLLTEGGKTTPAPRVVQLGVVDEAGKRNFFAGLDIFALPSRSDSFGLVLLEAWANGVPNVGYRAGGIADLLRHEQDSLQVPCGDVPALADALTLLCRDTSMRQRLGQAGRERLPQKFRWEDKLELVRERYMQITRCGRVS